MRKLAIAAVAACTVFTLSGCSGGSAASSSAAASSDGSASQSAASAEATAQKDFDGAAYSDTGAGTMVLATAGGTSEGGNVPQIPARENAVVQLELDFEGGDGSVCTVYVDGMENDKMNFGERSQNTLTVQGSDLAEGRHTVELVKMEGDAPAIYKVAEYECV